MPSTFPAPSRVRPAPLGLDFSLISKRQAGSSAAFALPLSPPPDSPSFGQEPCFAPALTPIASDAEPLVAVIGVGYVGAHLVSSFSSCWDVCGFDLSRDRIAQLSSEAEFRQHPRVCFSTRAADLADATHYLISVPTLLLADKTVDTSHLQKAIETVFQHARPGATVVIESSVAVGMTRELLGPLAKARGCFAGMSPERVDPGRVEPPASRIPKVISGLDDICPGSLAAITRLYAPVFETLVPVSRPEVAELTKLYENCQRMINIAYANEMADACFGLGIDPYEVCNAAGTKPFGYMDYAPGLGVGGHCIPVNPWYFLASGCEMPLLRRAAEATSGRPADVARTYAKHLRDKATFGTARVLVVGMGFKPGQHTLCYSPGLELARELRRQGDMWGQDVSVQVMFADPLVGQSAIPDIGKLANEDWNAETLAQFDLVIVAMRQHGLDFGELERARDVCVEWWCR
ncbi:hypothetical protein MAPG_11495 [Magnaporthiopsis poae ATCC 64411]|uniref:Nucleotide sugar dehydrogenase n=1 Tax=Magnaporthiopsis poae (strain ATCC 64411 / 73-15) TaxID=644358 RepID=A0A0C4EFF2_MAGP6|nr:hypothetical protein MAPG_11495 [Magnaporthiopsis poae ATCC 64411]